MKTTLPKLTRRDLLKTIALAGGGLALSAAPAWAAEPRVLPRASAPPKDALQTDVLVVGAGPSGVPAAIAAARAGAKVVLVEEDAVPGGAPVDMMVSMLCGGPRVGIFRDMIDRLNAAHDLTGQPVEGFEAGTKGGCNYWYLPSSYVQVIWEMLAAEPNIELMFGSSAVRALVSEGSRNRVRGVAVLSADGRERCIEAKVTVDATGTGLVAALAGCRTMYGRNARGEFNEPFGPEKADNVVMPCTWMFISQRLRPGPPLDVKRLRKPGMVETHVDHWVGKGGKDFEQRNAGVYLHWGATVRCDDTRDPVALARAQQAAFDKMKPDLDALRAQGFGVHLAPKLGVRECRRVLGEHVISVNDLKSGKLPDDTVALSHNGLDLWGERVPREWAQCPLAGIPYRALIPKDVEGLLVAGKAVSGTHIANSSYRIQPVMASIGQAAGAAAALAAQKQTDVRSVPVKELQEQLQAAGVIGKTASGAVGPCKGKC